MQVELPPIKMVGIEREIINFSKVTGVGQNVAATFGKAKKDMSGKSKNNDKPLLNVNQPEILHLY